MYRKSKDTIQIHPLSIFDLVNVSPSSTSNSSAEYAFSRDYDRELVLEQRTKLVARIVATYLKQHNTCFEKSIFPVLPRTCKPHEASLSNENADLAAEDERYIMRITAQLECQ